MPLPVVIELSPAEGAQPRQQRRFAAKRVQFANGLAHRGLGHFPGGVVIEIEPREREAIERRIRGVEELLECGLVATEQASNELGVCFHGSQGR